MKIIDRLTSSSDFLKLLLNNRHINSKDALEFLKPTSPNVLIAKDFGVNQDQLNKAVVKINQAVRDNKNILIYGDYDVDGITATAILWQVLYQKGAKVKPFIPHRENDGYGVKSQSFFNFENKNNLKIDLLITVDNGIVAHSELSQILKSGTEVIVVDHHVADTKLPKSIITIHSTKVSGSILSWILSKELDKNADLGLAALGAVTDCVPLNTINRNIVFHGLQYLKTNPNCGIKKLIQISGIKADTLSTYDLGFILGPRLNAVGRLSDPTDALRLLCSCSTNQASKFAQILDSFNKNRQNLQQESINLAQKKINNNSDKLIFIADKSFHPGIIGLIAGRLTEQYYLPSIIISIDNDIAKGSCRSIKELNIIEALRRVKSELIDLGGHAGAAGFSIDPKKIPKFQKIITKVINQELNNKELKPSTFIDAEMKLDAITIKNCKLIQKLEPFGIENPEPVFLFQNIKVNQKRLLGQNQEHLKLKLGDLGIDAIAFKKGDLSSNINVGDLISFTARLNLNVWGGNISPQLVVKDILK